MSERSLLLGFAASRASKCGELEIVAADATVHGEVILLSSKSAVDQGQRVAGDFLGARLLLDSRGWKHHVATSACSTVCDEGLGVITLDDWASGVLRGRSAQFVLSPSFFVRRGDRDALRALLEILAESTHPELIPHIATSADNLGPADRGWFLEELQRRPAGRPIAFTFTRQRDPFGHCDRLSGLRSLLEQCPGAWLLQLEPTVATDALAHGAGLVVVGASSSMRLPTGPEDKGGGPLSKGWLPGLFLRELFETRSPDIYSDWFANLPSPYCAECDRPLDVFEPTTIDKAAIVRHNLHATRDLVRELLAQSAVDRTVWLAEQRFQALRAHGTLVRKGAPPTADKVLLALCELDDPFSRQRSGWKDH